MIKLERPLHIVGFGLASSFSPRVSFLKLSEDNEGVLEEEREYKRRKPKEINYKCSRIIRMEYKKNLTTQRLRNRI